MGVNLRWDVRVIGDSQKIYRSTEFFDVDSLPPSLTSVGATVGSYDDTTTVNGTTYYYAIETLYGTRSILSKVEKVAAIGDAPAPPTWTPADLFTSGEIGAWYDPSDLSTMWTTNAKTTQVSADGDRVGYMSDLSGNAYDLTTPDAQRATYRTDGTYHWLNFDGINNQLGHNHNQTITDFIIASSMRADAHGSSVLYSVGRASTDPQRIKANVPWNDGNYYIDTYWSATGRISGVWTKAIGTDDVLTHARTGSGVTAILDGVTLGTVSEGTAVSGATTIYLGSFGGSSYYNGRMYGFCTVFGANSAQDQIDLEQYMAYKAGISL